MIGSAIYLVIAATGPTNDAATCMLRVDESVVREMIMARPASAEATVAVAALKPVLERCAIIDDQARDLALGAVAERWYRQSRRRTDYRVISTTEVGDAGIGAELSRRARAGWPALEALATCTTGYASPTVQRLLDTKAGSRDEESELAALGPPMSRCVDEGTPVTFSRAQLRAGFAREFYRSYVATVPQIERDLAKRLRTN